jgi:hypothetical protein
MRQARTQQQFFDRAPGPWKQPQNIAISKRYSVSPNWTQISGEIIFLFNFFQLSFRVPKKERPAWKKML